MEESSNVGAKQICFLACTDMEELSPNAQQSRQKLVKTMKDFAQLKPSVGFYFVDQLYLADTRKLCKECGLNKAIVEADIKGSPTIPDFED